MDHNQFALFGLRCTRSFAAMLAVLFSSVILAAGASAQFHEPTADPMHTLLTEKRLSECDDLAFNAERLIPRLHQEGKLDSVELVLTYIREHCRTDPFRDYIVLRNMESGFYAADWCDTLQAQQMLGIRRSYGIYFDTLWCGIPNIRYWPSYYANTDSTDYTRFLAKYSQEVLRQLDSTSFAHAAVIHRFAGIDQVIDNLAQRQYEGTCLQRMYDQRIAELLEKRKDFATNWSLNLGGWIPVGPIDVLGPKMEIGGQCGVRGRHFGVDLGLLFRFLAPKRTWVAGHKGKLYETNSFQSIYIGVEPNYTIYSSMGSRLEIFSGIGWDGILGLTPDVIDEDAGDYQNSLNVNFGFTQRFFYGSEQKMFFGLQARYNLVDFYTDGGTDLSGNTISINLIWGGMAHGSADYELSWLRRDTE